MYRDGHGHGEHDHQRVRCKVFLGIGHVYRRLLLQLGIIAYLFISLVDLCVAALSLLPFLLLGFLAKNLVQVTLGFYFLWP